MPMNLVSRASVTKTKGYLSKGINYLLRKARKTLPLAADLIVVGTLVTCSKYTCDESFKGEFYLPYVPENRSLIEDPVSFSLFLDKFSSTGHLPSSDLFKLLNTVHQTMEGKVRNNKGQLEKDDLNDLLSLAQKLTFSLEKYNETDDQWLAVVTQIKIVELLYLSLKHDPLKHHEVYIPFINLVVSISSQNYEDLASTPRSAEILGLKVLDKPQVVQAAINSLLYVMLDLSSESHVLSQTTRQEFLELFRAVEKRQRIGKPKISSITAANYLYLRTRNGYWYKNKYFAAKQYYRDLHAGGRIPIDIENVEIVSKARQELGDTVPLFKESCKAHQCPPTVLAAIALYNRLFKSGYPTYGLYSGLIVYSESKPAGSFDANAASWLGHKLKDSPFEQIAYQDRFMDFVSGGFFGACGTTGLMQIRACPLPTEERKNVRNDNLWERFGVDTSSWSTQRINGYLHLSNKYSVEAAAVLWEHMRHAFMEKREKEESPYKDFPAPLQFNNENWLAKEYPLRDIYGPDFFPELFDETYSDGYLKRSGRSSYCTFGPETFLFNVNFFPNQASISALHRVILQSGLFQNNADAIFVGISNTGQFNSLAPLLSSSDAYLQRAALGTLCEIQKVEEHPTLKLHARTIVDREGLTCPSTP